MEKRYISITGKEHKKRRQKSWVFRYILAGLSVLLIICGMNNISKINAENISTYDWIYYYEADKIERYNAYALIHPDLKPEDIVWMVNAGVDKPFYSDVKEIDLGAITVFAESDKQINGELNENGEEIFPLLINKYNKLPDDYEPQNLVRLDSGRLVTSQAREAFQLLCDDAKKLGYKINDVSAYRSISYQEGLYNRYLRTDPMAIVDTYSARSGYSEHHTGRAIDICARDWNMNNFASTAESPWINENAYIYGFIVRYQKDTEQITGYKYEPWHITYVGIEIATTMHEQGIKTLEEYVVKYIEHKPL